MRRRFAALLVAAAVLTGCGVPPPGEAQIDVDTPELREIKRAIDVEDCVPVDSGPVEGGMPDVTLPCLGGGDDVNLSGLRGPMVVNLWASWCEPCRTEMPILQEFHERYGDQVPIIGVDYQDRYPEAALELARDSGVTYPLLADPQADLQGAGPFRTRIGLPMFAFVAADGTTTVKAQAVEELDDIVSLAEAELGVSL